MKFLPYLWVAVVIILAVHQAGCAGSPSPTPATTPEPPLDPQAALRRAVTRLLQLESLAFTLEHQTGTTALFPGLEMSRASGVVDIPDSFRLRVEAESAFPRSFVEINIVTIEGRAYMTDFVSGEWREVPLEALPINLGNFGQSLADIVESVEGPMLVGTENLQGIDTHRIKGRVRSDDLGALVPGAGEGFEVELELWLDQDGGLLRQALITGQVLPSDIPGAQRLLTLDDIDLPVDISAPK